VKEPLVWYVLSPAGVFVAMLAFVATIAVAQLKPSWYTGCSVSPHGFFSPTYYVRGPVTVADGVVTFSGQTHNAFGDDVQTRAITEKVTIKGCEILP
jgi:hypothetical protein